jgi:hypothetical protein
MIKNAYQFGVTLALEALGLLKVGSEDQAPDAAMPEGNPEIPAEGLARVLREIPDEEKTRQTEAVDQPESELNFIFGYGQSSFTPTQSWGLDVRGPADTSV